MTFIRDGLADLAVKSTQDYQKQQTNEMEMLNEIDNDDDTFHIAPIA